MFESLMNVLTVTIQESKGKNIQVSNKIRQHSDKDSKYFIQNWLYELPKYRKWRITKLDGGERLQVFNTVAYPTYNSESPILGVDILWFGKSEKLLAVLDYQPLIQDKKYIEKYCSKLVLIKKEFSQFDNTKMKNLYDSKKYFSPWVIICRGNKSNLEKDLNNIFSLFLKEYFKIGELNNENQFLNHEQIKKAHIDYDKYSSEKDPADKIFISLFGEIWTNNFIKNFLFTLKDQ